MADEHHWLDPIIPGDRSVEEYAAMIRERIIRSLEDQRRS